MLKKCVVVVLPIGIICLLETANATVKNDVDAYDMITRAVASHRAKAWPIIIGRWLLIRRLLLGIVAI